MVQRVAVVVPIYKSSLNDLETWSLNRCAQLLHKYPLIFVHPDNIQTTAYKDIAPRFHYLPLPSEYFASTESYSRMLLGAEFYQRFADYEYILIHQTDAFVFEDQLEYWCARQYDYIGAPWCKDFISSNGHTLVAVGNGGFSLRRVPAFLAVLRSIPASWLGARLSGIARERNRHLRTGCGEDMFWGSVASRYRDYFKVAPIEEAVYFAFEMGLEHAGPRYDNRTPFGCHATWNLETLHSFLETPDIPQKEYDITLHKIALRAGLIQNRISTDDL